MSVPVDGNFVFTSTAAEGEEPQSISILPLGQVPRTYTMVEAAADGNEASFVVAALRNLGDADAVAKIRTLSAADWTRFLEEWRTFSRISVGE